MNLKMMFTQAISKDSLAAVVMWVLAMNQRPMGIDELCLWTASGDDRVRASIRTLEALEAVHVESRDRGSKFVSIATGCQDFLPGFAPALGVAAALPKFSGSEKSESDVIDAPFSSVDEPSPSEKSEGENVASVEDGQKSAKNANFQPENAPDSEKSEGQPLVKLSKLSTLNKELLTRLTKLTNVKKLCDFSHLLFERNVFYNQSLAGVDVLEALAWMAQVYESRTILNAPWGIVYHGMTRTMKIGKSKKVDPSARPETCYLDNPFRFLPKNYLDAVGLGEFYQPVCPACGRVEHSENCPDEMRRKNEHALLMGNQDALPENSGKSMVYEKTTVRQIEIDTAILSAWDVIRAKWENEMPRARFTTWVSDVTPVGIDGGGLVLSCRNKYAADWLQEQVIDKLAADSIELQNLAGCGITGMVATTDDEFFSDEDD